MPNYCRNTLVVKGENVKSFLQTIEFVVGHEDGERFSIIAALYPCPTELEETEKSNRNYAGYMKQKAGNIEKYGFPTWYEWKIANWGTKWGDFDTRIERSSIYYEIKDVKVTFPYEDEHDTEYIRFRFDTAWSPPIKAFERISKLYPALTFILRYTESGAGFKGEATFIDGTVDDTRLPYIPEWDDDYF
jgi:hypothetical protein